MTEQPPLASELQTARLMLRPYRFTDVPEMHDYLQVPAARNFLENADTTLTVQQIEAIIARHLLVDPRERCVWAITRDSRPMGAITINFEKQSRIAEIGYHISQRLWGQGYASEAANAVVNAAFTTRTQLQRIQAHIHPENTASIRVAERTGMRYEGTLRCYAYIAGEPADEAVYAVLRSDWQHPGQPE